ncbi:MAG TPA: F0F1 ATP synthase subunit B [Chthoniobacterales bacterium]|nr:F0F1 ATP synthase subunit B [Chthoniobacterales bacterium]
MNIAILAAADLGNMVSKTGETFGFDTKIFLSQVVSFVIVALVLRQFAYKPILAVLEERRQRIAEGLLNAEKIKQQLAEAEQRHADILAKANAQAQKMIDDARESAAHVGERKQQEAIVAAEQIIAKAHEASALERERVMTELKHQLGRLVVETTAKVTGKVLTPEDQKRLQEEATRQVAS